MSVDDAHYLMLTLMCQLFFTLCIRDLSMNGSTYFKFLISVLQVFFWGGGEIYLPKYLALLGTARLSISGKSCHLYFFLHSKYKKNPICTFINFGENLPPTQLFGQLGAPHLLGTIRGSIDM